MVDRFNVGLCSGPTSRSYSQRRYFVTVEMCASAAKVHLAFGLFGLVMTLTSDL